MGAFGQGKPHKLTGDFLIDPLLIFRLLEQLMLGTDEAWTSKNRSV